METSALSNRILFAESYTTLGQPESRSAGVLAGPKTGGIPLVSPASRSQERIVVFPLERSRVYSASRKRRNKLTANAYEFALTPTRSSG